MAAISTPAQRYVGFPQTEPSIEELLEDCILHALMKSDGVDLDTLERVVDSARRRLAAG
jgi:hypothetical protein